MARKGYSRRQYEHVAREDWYRFAVKPAMVLIGMYIVSILLKAFLDIGWEPFPMLFTGVGGIPFLIYYYKKELNIK